MQRYRSRCQRSMLALRTSESESSLLPTPTASNYGSNQGGAAGRVGEKRLSLNAMAARGLLATATATATANQLSPSMSKWPSCKAWQDLATLMPTPRASDAPRSMTTLGAQEYYQKRVDVGRATVSEHLCSHGVPGRLSPQFVEWMQGFPIEWTACELSEIPSSPSVQKLSGGSSEIYQGGDP